MKNFCWNSQSHQLQEMSKLLVGFWTEVDLKMHCTMVDIKMPGMNGIEALEKIVSTKRELPVIIHSAYSHFRENYLTWSAVAYVIKSGNLDELIQTVKNHMK